MDDSRFDALTRGLAAGKSRRSVLRGLIGGGAAVVAAKTGGTLAAPAPKVTICHFTGSASNPYQIISISSNAYAQHVANHGDFKYGNCCLDSECSQLGDQCHTGKCDKGTCVAVPNPGANCDDGNACTVNDVCKPNGICKGTPLDCSEYDDQCNTGECNGGACVAVPNPGVNCDDGNACTVGDVCDEDGSCKGTATDCSGFNTACTEGLCDPDSGCFASPINQGQLCAGECWVCDDGYCNKDDFSLCGECELCQEAYCAPSDIQNGASCTTDDGDEGICSDGICGCAPVNPCNDDVCGDQPDGCGSTVNCGSCVAVPPGCTNTPTGAAQCWWMENYSGHFCWVSAAGNSYDSCAHQDSCGGGGGGSGGGCYKWATSAYGGDIAPPW